MNMVNMTKNIIIPTHKIISGYFLLARAIHGTIPQYLRPYNHYDIEVTISRYH